MSSEENKAVVKKFYQLIEENNYDALKDLCTLISASTPR